MALSDKIQITDLEFDDIKINLKNYLSSQSQFQDYDFEGSGMSILLDLLAYNTHYMGYYANMLGNEMFMDSASIRESVVSHAKHLGVNPTSVKPAVASLNFTFTPADSPASLVIAKNTKFLSKIDGIKYRFVTPKSTLVNKAVNGTYTANGVEIKEGKILNKTYTVDTTDNRQRFIVPNVNVDTDSIIVNVQLSNTNSTLDTYTNGSSIDITTIKKTDKVFFIHEIEGQQYEITFGDGAVGSPLSDGNIIFIEYIVTGGAVANKANVFTASSTVAGLTPANYVLTTNIASNGGADIQSIESLKFLAPKLYSAQKRACTKDDYKAILLEQRPDIESITTYGGEDADPVQYGKVFIAIKPTGNTVFSLAAKQDIITNIIKQTNVVTVIPEIIDPTFIYLLMNTTVNYNPNTNLTDEVTLKSNVNNSIQSYLQSNIEKFDQKFRYSTLTRSIDNTANTIRNSQTYIRYAQRIYPVTFGVIASYQMNFNNPLKEGYLKSSQFVASDGNTYQLVDDTIGNIKAVKLALQTTQSQTWVNDFNTAASAVHRIDNTGTLHTGLYHYETEIHNTSNLLLDQQIQLDGSTNVGTIDYTTGKIEFVNFAPVSITSGEAYIQICAHPKDTTSDITPLREQILTYDVNDPESIVISMVSELI